MLDPLAVALRDLRNSPDTEAAGWRDAEDAAALRAILARLGFALVPIALDDAMRRAVWLIQAPHFVHTPAKVADYAQARVANEAQRALDRAAWAAMHQHAAERLGHG
jgi:hypothetical protein